MIEEIKRDFKGVWIPKEVWLDDRLSALDKIILTEIDSLDIDENGCYASNEYLAEFCQCSDTKVSTAVNKLIKLGYLEVIKFDGRKRYLKSRLLIFKRQTLKKLKADFKKVKDNNIDNNIDNNNNIYRTPTLEEIQAYCKERNNNIDYQKFYDYYEASNWKDRDGKQVKSWKQKIITWEGRNTQNKPKWLDKTFEEQKATIEEQKEMEDLLNEFK